MNVSFDELLALLKSALGNVSSPLYVRLGTEDAPRAVDSHPYNVVGGPDMVVDVDQNGNAIGIELL